MAPALVAGSLVLDVGTAVTLAVWHDSEFVTGTFGAGTFDLEGSTDGVAFSSDSTAPGKTLTFALGEALTYSLYLEADFGVTCSAATPPTTAALVTDRAADAAGAVDVLDLLVAGEPANLCFVVTADDLVQGETGSITWEFAGTSGATIS